MVTHKNTAFTMVGNDVEDEATRAKYSHEQESGFKPVSSWVYYRIAPALVFCCCVCGSYHALNQVKYKKEEVISNIF